MIENQCHTVLLFYVKFYKKNSISYACYKLIQCGSEKGVRENGHFRLEGKDYIVRDGDILSIRFSV
ncbi:MAG: DUF933 domain-containing protein [Syntrophales bacterium]